MVMESTSPRVLKHYPNLTRYPFSRTVYDHVQNKLNFVYEYQGEHQVKNIANPLIDALLLSARCQ